MKKQDITYQDKLNELRLDVSHPNSKGHAFVLVEGDTDIRLFRKFFNLENCKVETIPGGKFKLEECVGELLTVYSLVIGIRDADFIHLDSTTPYTKTNMFLTDFHDIEMTLMAEDEVLSALVFEYTSIPVAEHISTRNDIIKSIEQISYLKWLTELENLEIKFDAGFQDLISFSKFEINFTEYFQRLLSKSPNAKITDVGTIVNKINDLKSKDSNPFQLCNGHDFMKAFSQFIKAHGKVKTINDEILSSAFRMCFRNEFLTRTKLYQQTKSWSDSNSCEIYL